MDDVVVSKSKKVHPAWMHAVLQRTDKLNRGKIIPRKVSAIALKDAVHHGSGRMGTCGTVWRD